MKIIGAVDEGLFLAKKLDAQQLDEVIEALSILIEMRCQRMNCDPTDDKVEDLQIIWKILRDEKAARGLTDDCKSKKSMAKT